MAGKQQKRYEDLVNKRGDRRRVLVQIGPGLAMWVKPGPAPPLRTAEERDALAAAYVAEWDELHASPKARIARAKPRDARGRFVPAHPTEDAGAA